MKVSFVVICDDLPWTIGVQSISACLKMRGVEVETLIVHHVTEGTLRKIGSFVESSDLVGLPVFTNHLETATRITTFLQKTTQIPIIWGGIHPTLMPEECITVADIICIGEGEESVTILAERISNKQDYTDIDGIWVRCKETIFRNLNRPLIDDLDALPFPDWTLDTTYFFSEGLIRQVQQEDFPKISHYPMPGTYLAMTSRGCPFACTYCCNNAISKIWPGNRRVRYRSVDNVIEELILAKTKIESISCFLLDDDSFFCRPDKEIEYFCQRYKNEVGKPLGVYGITPDTYSPKKFSLLVSAGMCFCRMGIQSASESTKRLYNRRHSNKKVMSAVLDINRHSDEMQHILYDVITDSPWESEKDSIITLNFLSRFPLPYYLNLFSLRLFPGTDLYDLAKAEGLLIDEQKNYSKYDESFINKLFLLLHHFAQRGSRITPLMMFLLTLKPVIRIGWSKKVVNFMERHKHTWTINSDVSPLTILAKYIKERVSQG